MKVTKSRTKSLRPRSKFSLLNAEFLKEGALCSWNKLRAKETVDIDSKALLEGNGLKVPNGHSVTTFIEQELGVDVVKSTNKEDKVVVGIKEDDDQQSPEPETPDLPEEENSEPENPGLSGEKTNNENEGVED